MNLSDWWEYYLMAVDLYSRFVIDEDTYEKIKKQFLTQQYYDDLIYERSTPCSCRPDQDTVCQTCMAHNRIRTYQEEYLP
jgi:hypothetical protein